MARGFELHITFAGVPSIWRDVYVPGDISLARLHDVIQALMSWEERHLHAFNVNGVEYGTVLENEDQGAQFAGSDDQITVVEAVERSAGSFTYTYDFGDNWELSIRVKSEVEGQPSGGGVLCLRGEMAGPPEDFGGAHAYREFLSNWRAKGARGLSRELRGWLPKRFEPETFLLREANDHIRLMPPPIGSTPDDETKLLDDVAVVTLFLASWIETSGERRAWKNVDFSALDRMQAAGLLSFSNTAKSLYFTDGGARRAQALIARLMSLNRS